MELYFFDTTKNDFVNKLHHLLAQHNDTDRSISKSYTKDAMVLCINRNDWLIGVDVEQKRDRSVEVFEHFAHTFHTFGIKDIPKTIEESWFYKAWTAMESFFKLEGKGFGTPKDFILDIERQSIWRNEKEIAWFEYFDIENCLICLCSNKKFAKESVKIHISC